MGRLGKLIYVCGSILFLTAFSLAGYYASKMHELGEPVSDEKIPDYRYHFMLIPEELDNDYWRLVEKGARDAAEENHILLEYVGPKQSNIDEHLRKLNIAAASKVDGVLTQGYNDKQFTPVINYLANKGVPVITVDTDAPSSHRRAYIGTDNYYSGFLAGKALIDDTIGVVNVAIITGSFKAEHQKLRVKGFKDAIAKEKRINIVAIEESNITRIRAAEKAYKILSEHPETNAFYGTSALDGIGIAQSVFRLRRQDSTYIMAFDTIAETLEYIRRGVIDATVVQKPYEMGFNAVEMMIKIQEGKPVPKINYTETRIMHKNDLPDRSEEIMP
ncbi:sugar-binding protein [Heyndrickxia sp. NPDC080065]|uniref:sugar-binding protein n=1 Tax=Heyndrickxia sp. NPDC080065 TaxID=3390568 RepID=UPI003D025046